MCGAVSIDDAIISSNIGGCGMHMYNLGTCVGKSSCADTKIFHKPKASEVLPP